MVNMKQNPKLLRFFFVLLISFTTQELFAQRVPEIPAQCHQDLKAGRECLVSQIKCDAFLCLTGEFQHDLFVKLERSAIGTKQDAIRNITRFELWPAAVAARDPQEAIIRVHQSQQGPFRYDEENELLEAIQYADFEANSPIGWQAMTMVNRFQIVENAESPSYGQSFLTTRVLVDTGYDVGEIGDSLPASRGIKFMDGYLHLVEDAENPDFIYAVYRHRLRIGFDLAPYVAEASISNVILTITGALIDVMSQP